MGELDETKLKLARPSLNAIPHRPRVHQPMSVDVSPVHQAFIEPRLRLVAGVIGFGPLPRHGIVMGQTHDESKKKLEKFVFHLFRSFEKKSGRRKTLNGSILDETSPHVVLHFEMNPAIIACIASIVSRIEK